MPVSAVVFVLKLPFAILTGCQIGSDKRHGVVVNGMDNGKCAVLFAVSYSFVVIVYLKKTDKALDKMLQRL